MNEQQIRQDERTKVITELMQLNTGCRSKYDYWTLQHKLASMLPKEEVKQPIQDDEIKVGDECQFNMDGGFVYTLKAIDGLYTWIVRNHDDFNTIVLVERLYKLNKPTKSKADVLAEKEVEDFLTEKKWILMTKENRNELTQFAIKLINTNVV